jgi:hypothetical protein
METTMKRTLTLSLPVAFALTLAIGSAAHAQSNSAGNLTTAKPAGTTEKRKPTATATPEMINEAIQRSEARTAKARAAGITEQWGTEEPFTYNPAVRRFNPDQQ